MKEYLVLDEKTLQAVHGFVQDMTSASNAINALGGQANFSVTLPQPKNNNV
ncbi:MAG TPA: hypothetical protein VIN59_00055 [Alphaproteobacteria bacterium]